MPWITSETAYFLEVSPYRGRGGSAERWSAEEAGTGATPGGRREITAGWIACRWSRLGGLPARNGSVIGPTGGRLDLDLALAQDCDKVGAVRRLANGYQITLQDQVKCNRPQTICRRCVAIVDGASRGECRRCDHCPDQCTEYIPVNPEAAARDMECHAAHRNHYPLLRHRSAKSSRSCGLRSGRSLTRFAGRGGLPAVSERSRLAAPDRAASIAPPRSVDRLCPMARTL